MSLGIGVEFCAHLLHAVGVPRAGGRAGGLPQGPWHRAECLHSQPQPTFPGCCLGPVGLPARSPPAAPHPPAQFLEERGSAEARAAAALGDVGAAVLSGITLTKIAGGWVGGQPPAAAWAGTAATGRGRRGGR